jgi:hypothetical protein
MPLPEPREASKWKDPHRRPARTAYQVFVTTFQPGSRAVKCRPVAP